MLVSRNFVDLITFTRSSPAWRFNSSGLLVQATDGVARFDYDPVTRQPRGLLIEEARTNYALWCRDLTNAAWVKTSCSATLTATGIDGSANSSSTLTATGANATCLQAITRASAQRITGLYIKRRTGSGVINMTQDGGTTWAPVTVTSAYTRVNLAAATLANPSIGLQVVTSGDAIDVDFVSHEEGAFLTSPILTTSAAASRSADAASITDLSKIGFNPVEGTFFSVSSYRKGGTAQNGRGVLCVDDGTSNNLIAQLYDNGTERIWPNMSTGGVSQLSSPTYAAAAPDAVHKFAMSYSAADVQACMDGGSVYVDSTVTIPAVNALRIGSYYAGNNRFLSGWIESLQYYPRRLSSAELQALTA